LPPLQHHRWTLVQQGAQRGIDALYIGLQIRRLFDGLLHLLGKPVGARRQVRIEPDFTQPITQFG
jgi:hypothetical protein